MQKTNKAFTLVELIVVITILAILGTIAFISLQGYSKKARDSKRTADISNIKVSLELFSLNTGYYPLPDSGEEVLYDNDLLWTQGIVGNNVTTNLSRNLLKKPTDPLHDIEYIYSLASSKKEYEVMSIYEGDLANNSLINSTYAEDKYNIKVEGNYNELFVKTSNHIFPIPSLITSATLPLDFDLVPSAIESQVITGGDNFPGLNIPNIETSTGGLKMTLSVYNGSINKDSIDDDKKAVVEKIQLAYSGSDIETTSIYKTLLAKTTDEELLAFVDDVVLNKTSSVTETKEIKDIKTVFDVTVTPSYLNVSNYTYRTMFYIPEFQSLYYMNDSQATSTEVKRVFFPDINNIQIFTETSVGTVFNESTAPNTTSRGTFYYNNYLYQTGYSGNFIRKISVNSATDFVQSSVITVTRDVAGSWGMAVDEANSRILMSGDTTGCYPSWVPFDLSTGTVSTSASNAIEFGGKGYQGAIGIDPLTGYYYIAETYSSNEIHEYDENQNFIKSFTVNGLSGIGSITVTDKHLFVSADNTNLARIYYWER